MKLNKKAEKIFWRQEAKEKDHASIKKDLEKAASSKKSKPKNKIKKVMTEFSKDKLHSGSKKGPKVTDRKQAIAIAINSAKKSKVPKKKK